MTNDGPITLATESQPRVERRRHRRAGRACLYCRNRKVRCDATVRNNRCTNCLLDGVECITSGLSAGPIRTSLGKLTPRPDVEPTMSEVSLLATPDSMLSLMHSSSRMDRYSVEDGTEERQNAAYSIQSPTRILHNSANESYQLDSECNLATGFPLASWTSPPQAGAMYGTHQANKLPQPKFAAPGHSSWVPFSTYEKIKLSNISNISAEFIQFLETQGCLRVPAADILETLLKGYFTHFHPMMPLLDETEFWSLFRGFSCSPVHPPFISLFLLHAMLAICCPSAPQSVIQALGFSSYSEARRTCHRRAQLLFDLEAEGHVVPLVQGCVLLTQSHSNTGNADKDGSYWLSIATRLAQQAGMHIAEESIVEGGPNHLHQRIWQCIVVRDRLMALGCRRPLQIPPDQCNFSITSTTVDKLFPELDITPLPSVTLYGTRKPLVELFIQLCRLSVVIIDVVNLAYPAGKLFPVANLSLDTIGCNNASLCRGELSRWHETTLQGRDTEDEIVIAFFHMLDIFYHSAILALHHHDIFRLNLTNLPGHVAGEAIKRAREGIADSTLGLTESFHAIMLSNVPIYLTISMLAYLMFPLIVHSTNIHLATEVSRLIASKKILSELQQLLDVMELRFDNAAFIRTAKDEFTRILNKEMQEFEHSRQQDIVNCDLRLYVLLPVYVGFILSRGRLPQGREFTQYMEGYLLLPRNSPETSNTQHHYTEGDDSIFQFNTPHALSDTQDILGAHLRESSLFDPQLDELLSIPGLRGE